jgi:four helix bundle protein
VNDSHPIVPVARRYAFDHHRLHAYDVALEALVRGAAIVKSLPRGYGSLADQLRRALQGAFLQTTEAAARTGADRNARFRSARAEAGEAAGALEAIARLKLADPAAVQEVLALLWRLCGMLTRLAGLGR